MTWARLDDHANEHRKQLAAGPEACWMWACGLMYANRQLSRDGVIPEAALAVLYPFRNPKKLASRLVEVGLWVKVEGGYKIHEFHYWNKTADELAADRALTRIRVAAHRARKRDVTTGNAVTPLHVTPPCNDDVLDPLHSTPVPDQIPPVSPQGANPPSEPKRTPEPKPERRRWTRVRQDWQPSPKHVELAKSLGVDLRFESAKFRDHEFATPKRDEDAAFANWLRNAAKYARPGPPPGALEHQRNGGLVDIDPPARTVIRPAKRDGLPMAQIGDLAAAFLGGRR